MEIEDPAKIRRLIVTQFRFGALIATPFIVVWWAALYMLPTAVWAWPVTLLVTAVATPLVVHIVGRKTVMLLRALLLASIVLLASYVTMVLYQGFVTTTTEVIAFPVQTATNSFGVWVPLSALLGAAIWHWCYSRLLLRGKFGWATTMAITIFTIPVSYWVAGIAYYPMIYPI